MKMEQIECSETSAYKIQMPGNYPVENIQHTEHGESLKSRISNLNQFISVVQCLHGARYPSELLDNCNTHSYYFHNSNKDKMYILN
jgi:hypothetical protein